MFISCIILFISVIYYCLLYYLYSLNYLLYLICFLNIGSIGDWSTIFMTTELQMSDLTASIGYCFAAVMMAFGRIYSDYLRHKFDAADLLMYSGLFASSGLLLFSLIPLITNQYELQLGLTYFSLFFAGAGISVSSPVILSMASNLPGVSPTKGIAIVTTPSYLGYLIGPPLIGFLSYSLHGLKWALLICSLFILLIPLLCKFGLKRKGPSMSRHPSLSSSVSASGFVPLNFQ